MGSTSSKEEKGTVGGSNSNKHLGSLGERGRASRWSLGRGFQLERCSTGCPDGPRSAQPASNLGHAQGLSLSVSRRSPARDPPSRVFARCALLRCRPGHADQGQVRGRCQARPGVSTARCPRPRWRRELLSALCTFLNALITAAISAFLGPPERAHAARRAELAHACMHTDTRARARAARSISRL